MRRERSQSECVSYFGTFSWQTSKTRAKIFRTQKEVGTVQQPHGSRASWHEERDQLYIVGKEAHRACSMEQASPGHLEAITINSQWNWPKFIAI